MPSPVTAEDLAPFRITAESSPCQKAQSLVKSIDILYALLGYMFDENGGIGAEFKADLGAAGISGSGDGSSSIGAPSGVAATSDRTSDVKVTWSGVSGATSYSVFRGTSSDTASMGLVGTVTVTEFLDTNAVVGTVYFYAVKSISPSLLSGFSAVASGKRISGSGLTPIITDNANSPTEVTVPDTAATMTLEMWGSGGTGGGASSTGWVAPVPGYTAAGGGGGASGSYFKLVNVAVTPGDKYYLLPGRNGGSSTVYKASVGNAINAYAKGGLPGGNSTFNVSVGIGGLPATAPEGVNNLGSGTRHSDSAVGLAGENGTLSPGGGVAGVGGAGGAAIEVGGHSGGAGGSGTITASGNAGMNGLIIVTFHE